MIEAFQTGNRWTWRLICALGRTLVYTSETFPTDMEAADQAKQYRTRFWAVADGVDHRQARCI